MKTLIFLKQSWILIIFQWVPRNQSTLNWKYWILFTIMIINIMSLSIIFERNSASEKDPDVYECPQCSNSFLTYSDLKFHLRTTHIKILIPVKWDKLKVEDKEVRLFHWKWGKTNNSPWENLSKGQINET